MSAPARTAHDATRPMLGLTLRRERLHGTAWYLTSALLLVVIAAGVAATYPTASERRELATSVNANAGELFVIGPIASTDVGGVGLWRTLGIATIFISLASVLTVVRNTRAPEESGTYEMLGSAAIGRTAPLVAALGVTALGAVTSGVLVAAGFVAIGAATTGAVLVGAQVAVIGLLAASLAGLTGQVVQTARGATGTAIALVAVFFLLRGAGDAIGGRAYWLSPFGWIASVRPFADDDAVMLLPALGLTIVISALALRIASRRDLGAGLLPERAGPAHASSALRGPTSLAVRSSRGAVVVWTIGALLVGILIGAISSTVDEQADLSLGGAAAGGTGLVQVALYLCPLFAAILGVQVTLRLRAEVTSGRFEAILARPVARSRWLLAHGLTGALASTASLVAFGLGLGLSQLGTDPGSSWSLIAAAALRIPAAWVFIALAGLLLATIPRAATAVTFAAIGAFQALELAVELQLVPQAALSGSPFAQVPQLPDGPTHPWQSATILAIAVVLATTAARAIRTQDVG